MHRLHPFAWLALALAIAVAVLVGVHALTAERIAANAHRAQLQALAIVLPATQYDNDPLADRITVIAPAWLGSAAPITVRRARRGSRPAALVLDAVAPDGYNGPIRLLIAIQADGRIGGVRVTSHRETPGLGDPLDIGVSDWITGFDRRTLDDPPAARWAVRKDGGAFDQFAGATTTPRAVIRAVHRALQFVVAHGEALYAAPAGSSLRLHDAPDDPVFTR